jgi:hypothetical protein
VIYDAFVSGAQNHEKLIKQVVFWELIVLRPSTT